MKDDEPFWPYMFASLPQVIKSKILIYYLSFGTISAYAIRKEINYKCRNNTISLWFANVDYIINYNNNNKKYMLQKLIGIGCDFQVICDLRLAIIDNNILNGTLDNVLKARQIDIIKMKRTITKHDLLRLLREEEEET
jgi:hypothetical protein